MQKKSPLSSLRKSLLFLLGIHIYCTLAIGGFSIYTHQRAARVSAARPEWDAKISTKRTEIEAMSDATLLRDTSLQGLELLSSARKRLDAGMIEIDSAMKMFTIAFVVMLGFVIHALLCLRKLRITLLQTQAGSSVPLVA
jgi:hypothetical protein